MKNPQLRKTVEDRLSALKRLREDYDSEWFDIARFTDTHRSRFLTSSRGAGGSRNKTNRGERRTWNNKLADSYGVKSFRILANGMTSGLTSASRPWFALKAEDAEMMEFQEVREWLSEVERRMYAFLAKTNFYGASKSGYKELGLFGTEACLMMEHRTKGAVCHNFTAGEYWIATGDARVPDVLYRHCPLTVREAVQTFGDKVSKRVRDLYDKGTYTEILNFFQAVEPNSDYSGAFGQFPWRSIYWDADDDAQTIISVSGFMEQPFWAPRWDVASGDTYGVSPAMEALPAIRETQMVAKRRNEIIDQLTKPEKIVPPNVRLTGQAGRTVTASGITKEMVVVPYQPPWQAMQGLMEERMRLYQEIDAHSFAELFNAITNMAGVQPRTVEEIAARNEEKLTQLGPVIERVGNEKLAVIIERTYGIMLRGGFLPPVPEAFGSQSIKIEFISMLAQAQRLIGIGGIERTASFVGGLAAVNPEAIDKMNFDELIDDYADRAGAPPKMIRGKDEVEKMRAERAQQEQMAQMAAMAPAMNQGAQAAKVMSEISDMGDRGGLPAQLPV
jgi:hypothetical protein